MKHATDEILAHLSSGGYRVTKARKAVIHELVKATQPITVPELVARLKGVDEASVYRTVRTLLDENLLEEILISQGSPRYALAHGHHHHAVCTSCGVLEHIACELEKMRLPKGFSSVSSHDVTLYGLCKKCA